MAGSAWTVFAPATKAKSSEVNANFDWIEGSIVPMNAGNTTDAAYDLGTLTARWRSSYHSLRVNTPAIGLSDTSFFHFDATGTITADKPMKMANGVAVNEFSIDGTMGGNSDLAVPTEKAVKTYADTRLSFTSTAILFSTPTGVGWTTGLTLSITADGSPYLINANAFFQASATTTAGDIKAQIMVAFDSPTDTSALSGSWRTAYSYSNSASAGQLPQITIPTMVAHTPSAGGHTYYLMYQMTPSGSTFRDGVIALTR